MPGNAECNNPAKQVYFLGASQIGPIAMMLHEDLSRSTPLSSAILFISTSIFSASLTLVFKEKNGEDIRVKVKGNLRSDAGKLLLDAALNGQGVLIGPTYMVADAMREARLQPALEDYQRPSTGLYAVYPLSKLVSSKVRAFVDYLVGAWSGVA